MAAIDLVGVPESPAEPERVSLLNDCAWDDDGELVLYWMQASHRSVANHALEHAVALANDRNVPLVVAFALTQTYHLASRRHYGFMIEGLADACRGLAERGIGMLLLTNDTDRADDDDVPVTVPDVVVAAATALKAGTVVTDGAYLRPLNEWRSDVGSRLTVPLVQVEANVVVPVETASAKMQWAARTLRSRIWQHVGDFLTETTAVEAAKPSVDIAGGLHTALEEANLRVLPIDTSGSLQDARDTVMDLLTNVDDSVDYVEGVVGGTTAAYAALEDFVASGKARSYKEDSSKPSVGCTSRLSAYLHYGQISPIDALLTLKSLGHRSAGQMADAYTEQLVVRRELAINFCHYLPDGYDSYEDALPDFAKTSLALHANDERPYLYTKAELEEGRTHDAYWNAAQLQMVHTGFMHNYMRMYWGKKVIEWTESPEEAFETVLYLNDKYEYDGRDPNGYASIAWLFGRHDQGWREREVFGKVRYMNAAGLKRKFKIDDYVEQIAAIVGEPIMGDGPSTGKKGKSKKRAASARGGGSSAASGRKRQKKA